MSKTPTHIFTLRDMVCTSFTDGGIIVVRCTGLKRLMVVYNDGRIEIREARGYKTEKEADLDARIAVDLARRWLEGRLQHRRNQEARTPGNRA